MCFEGLARLSRRVRRRFVRGSREISLVPSLHRASTDALIGLKHLVLRMRIMCACELLCGFRGTSTVSTQRKSNNVCQRTVSKDLRDALIGIPIYACEVLIFCLLVLVCCRFAHKPLASIVTKTDCNGKW